MKHFFLLLLMALSWSPAQDNSGFDALKLNGDVRTAALSGSGSALTGDAGVVFVNPAGMLAEGRSSAVFQYRQTALGAAFHTMAAVFAMEQSAFSVDAAYLAIPGIEIRGVIPTDEPQGVTDAFNLAVGVSYARYLGNWQWGVKVKYLFEKYYLATAPGWAVDWGVQRRDVAEDTDWGLTIQNVGRMAPLDQQATPLPLTVRSGFRYGLMDDVSAGTLNLIPEIIWRRGERLTYSMGLIYAPLPFMRLLGGAGARGEVLTWSAGLSVQYGHYVLRYAYGTVGYGLPGSHSFGASFYF
ncbi:MAG: hypothetical protein D6677_07710 [Calditrichaeota bacterium]|nr:MAG: hypothetical protein D6677_07710 [Calditrichota bacterium]